MKHRVLEYFKETRKIPFIRNICMRLTFGVLKSAAFEAIAGTLN